MKPLLKYFNNTFKKFNFNLCDWSWYVSYNSNIKFKNIRNKKNKK
jgi:hypothetical protein